ncbi:MAG: hypothetical protein J7M38_14965 [Armatimonadetes bacterium]|nr:hypothetical protein [Armatimonadota bacterium]
MDMHTERQAFAAWVHLLLIVCVVLGIWVGLAAPNSAARWSILLSVGLVLVLYAMFTPMTVRVNSERLAVDFGFLGWPRWRFPIAEITSAEVLQFSPMRDFGGWGIKGGRLGMCLNQRGDRGVRIEFRGRRYVIGSDDPEALLQALHTAGVPRTK